MAIERNLPENRQRHLDQQVAHWEATKRDLGAALEFLKKAHGLCLRTPQKTEQVVLDQFNILERLVREDLNDASEQVEASIRWTEDHNNKPAPIVAWDSCPGDPSVRGQR